MRIGSDRCEPERGRNGTAIARPVEGNQPDAALGHELLPETQVQPGTGGPVEVHDHGITGLTRVTDPQHSPAALYFHLVHLTIVTPPATQGNETVTGLARRLQQASGERSFRWPAPAARDRAGDGWIDTSLVFTTRYGTPIEPRNFNRSFDRCITAARVPRITVHSTRRTCASLLAALDVHPRVAMRILRHSKIAVTMEIYIEAPSDATRDALRKLGD